MKKKNVAEIQEDFKSSSHGVKLTEVESMEKSCGANGRRFQKPVMSVQCFDDTFCGRAHNEVYWRRKETLKLMGVIFKTHQLNTRVFSFFFSCVQFGREGGAGHTRGWTSNSLSYDEAILMMFWSSAPKGPS